MRRRVRMSAVVAMMAVLASGPGATGVTATAPDGHSKPSSKVSLTRVSGPVAGAHSCTDSSGVESDLSVVVNPRNPNNVVAAWSDDLEFVVVASSFDGGRSWERTVVEGLTRCTGGESRYMNHTRLAFGPDGRLWLSGEQLEEPFPDPRSGINPIPVVTSGDGGRTWSSPTYVNEDPFLNGFDTLTALPDMPNAAVVAWHAPEPVATVHVSRTADGGKTWTRHDLGGSGGMPFLRILARPSGDLFLFMTDASMASFAGGAQPLTVRRSTDGGVSWSRPVRIAPHAGRTWSSAVALDDGSIVVTYPLVENDKGFVSTMLGEAATYVSQRSTDDGNSWSGPVVIAENVVGPAPVLARTADGVLGMSYTTTVEASDPDGIKTQVQRFARSGDSGETWAHITIAGPFEPPASGAGFFAETAGFRGGFAAVFAQGEPGNEPSDAYVAIVPATPPER